MTITRKFKSKSIHSVAFGALVLAASPALAHHATEIPLDETAMVGGVNAMCTGAGLNSRQEAVMNGFPLRVEIAGRDGQYLGDQAVEITGENMGGEIAVYCKGPWVLFDVPAGQYTVTTFAEHSSGNDGLAKTATVNVGAGGQGRLVMHFPDLGGAVSRQQVATLD
jgi:hypothetical protein